MKFHKPHRLKWFDYSSACSYLLTFTTKGRAPILSKVIYRGMYEPSAVELLPYGTVTEKYLPSVKAYILVPIVGSLFADFINSLTITFFINAV